MAHDHSGGHSHAPASFGRAFGIGIFLNTTFVVIEAAFGVLFNSLALIADAGHNLSDVAGLVIAWIASVLVKRKPTARRTYGLRRSSILGALINAVLLLVAIGAIAWEAIKRLQEPSPVEGWVVIGVAAVGVFINTITALMFMSGRKHDLNIRGAYLHMAADAGVSLGVVLAGVGILLTGWLVIDPLISLAIVAIIFIGTWGLLRDSVNLALDAVPEGINIEDVQAYLLAIPGVTEVHDLHVWAMSTTETALTAHLIMPGVRYDDALLARVSEEMHDKFSIEHATLQLETGDVSHPCRFCTAVVQSKIGAA